MPKNELFYLGKLYVVFSLEYRIQSLWESDIFTSSFDNKSNYSFMESEINVILSIWKLSMVLSLFRYGSCIQSLEALTDIYRLVI